MDPIEKFREFIKKKGLRNTPEREIIIREIFSTHDHFDADQLFLQLRTKRKAVSKASIYRTIPLLIESGLIKEVSYEDGHLHYEHVYGHKHHDHLVCVQCGSILEFYSPEIENLQGDVTQRMGFHGLQHRMEIYGLCANCLSKKESSMPLTMASPGEKVRIVQLLGGTGIARRLTSMGLYQGAEVEVLKSRGPGPLIVAAQATRIALGFGMAQQILVSAARRRK